MFLIATKGSLCFQYNITDQKMESHDLQNKRKVEFENLRHDLMNGILLSWDCFQEAGGNLFSEIN